MAKESFIASLNLNDVQSKAVLCDTGSELVFAGAGTGKTRVLTAKIAWLIKEKGILPWQILAATFTNKAAKEMRERVSQILGTPCNELWIGTFHSLCARILRREAEHLGYTSSFTIYDTSDQLVLVKRVMSESNIDEKSLPAKKILYAISSFKNQGIKPEAVLEQADSYYAREIATLYQAYQNALQAANSMDFDDLITNVVFLFAAFPAILKRYQEHFRYILIDEYQDTNSTQFLLIHSLASAGAPVFAVGDDDQSIYGWRGAQIENILNFAEHFPGTKVFKLEQNYRSIQPILTLANAVISSIEKRAGKKLWSNKKSDTSVRLSHYADDRREAEHVVETIATCIRQGEKPNEIAILFRTNAQSRLFEENLRRAGVSYVLVGGTSFYERKEIKDILAYMRMFVNMRDDVSTSRILNVPARSIGATSQKKIQDYAREHRMSYAECILSADAESLVSGKARSGILAFRTLVMQMRATIEARQLPLHEIVSTLIGEIGYVDRFLEDDTEESRSRIENINELINALAFWQEENPTGGMREFLEETILVRDTNRENIDKAVHLMTLHTAKGLEFERVFLVGLEDGLLPTQQTLDDPSKMDEECRLLYVGITRARTELSCSYGAYRMRFGTIMPMSISRFLTRISSDLYQYIDETGAYETFPESFTMPHSSLRMTRARKNIWNRDGDGDTTQSNFASLGLRRGSEYTSFTNDAPKYSQGQQVQHASYGRGKIMSVSGFGGDIRVTVLFEGGVRKQLIAKFAKLQIV